MENNFNYHINRQDLHDGQKDENEYAYTCRKGENTMIGYRIFMMTLNLLMLSECESDMGALFQLVFNFF